MSRRLLAVAVSFLLPGLALPAQVPQTAIVLQTTNAKLNTNDAAIGTTVFDGDRIETQSKGAMNVRSGEIQFTLPEESTLWMNHENSSAMPRLQRGTVIFRAENGTGVEVVADDVHVRPHNPVLTVGEVTLKDCEVLVTARTQSLEVTAGKETKILEEGKTYRVVRKGACAAYVTHAPLSPGTSRFFILPIAIATGVIIWGVHSGTESPDRP